MKTRSWHHSGWKSLPVCVVSKALLTGVWTCLFIASCPAAIVLSIDYSLDENGFFSGDQGGSRKAALEMACEAFEGIFSDHLLPIVPDEGNTWSAMGFHPATGDPGVLAEHRTIPADTIVIFAGGRPLPSGNVAQGGPGGWSASYTQVAWIDQLMNRGQTGITDGLGNQLEEISDFSLWGGTITFDNDSTVWHTQPEANVPEGQFDFYTAALHELAHALGFGTSDSWLQQVVDGKLDGRYSSMGYGADAVPLHAAGEGALFSHWIDGVGSAGLVDLSWQPTTMGPYLSHGEQRRMTYLDALGLADVGWSVRLPSLPDAEGNRGALTRLMGEVRLREAAGAPIEGVRLLARHDRLAFESSSEVSGAYALSVYANTEYHLTAQKDHESRANRGVDVSDIVLMRKHILSAERLDSLVSRVAADVNRDHSIDVLDIVAMRKMILGMRDDYASESSPQSAANSTNSTNWRLLDARIAELPDQASLEEVQAYEGRSFTGVNADFLDVDWLAVKLGDVNGDWQP